MNSLPFSTTDLQTSDIEAIVSVFDTLRHNFDVSYEPTISFDFNILDIFINKRVNNGPVIRITNNFQSFELAFIHVGYTYSYGQNLNFGLIYEYQAWGITTLKNDFGHILIKPETLSDKIHELINPIEIKFHDDPVFNKNFYVVTNDEAKASLHLNEFFRTQIKNLLLKDFVIEILGNKLIIGNRKIIQPDSAISFVKFMDGLSGLC